MNVLVDDNDPSVRYSSTDDWHQIGKAPEFRETTHEALVLNKPATLEFCGTSITVFGTIGNGQAGMSFSIDGRPSGSFDVEPQSAQGHNQHFWTSPPLEDTLHNLTIVLDHDSNLHSSRTLFLDYFVYTTASTAGKSVLIDDSDTVLKYSESGWQAENDSDNSLERTQHVSNSQGSWVWLCFEGTQISLFGTGSVSSSVTNGTPSSANLQSREDPPDKQLFQSHVLPQGNHTLNITVGSSTAIDYFLVTTNMNTTTAIASTTSGLSVSSSAGAYSTQQSSASDSMGTGPGNTMSTARNGPPITAIVGGAVGGLALLLLLLVAALLWRRRARRVEQPGTSESYYPWANKRESVTSLTTLTEDDDRERPKNFEKERPPSRYIYYE